MLLLYVLLEQNWFISCNISGETMWYAAVVRFIRRRLVLGIIFASSLTYCIVSFLREVSYNFTKNANTLQAVT